MDAMQIMRQAAKVGELEAAMRAACVQHDRYLKSIPLNDTQGYRKAQADHIENIRSMTGERHGIIVAMCNDGTFAASGLSWEINWSGVR